MAHTNGSSRIVLVAAMCGSKRSMDGSSEKWKSRREAGAVSRRP